MTPKEIIITKASGEKATFSSKKLRYSLERSGANEETINAIINDVESKLYEGITTKQIYQAAFDSLKKDNKPFAAKYKLKEAIMELGPPGYPFEKFISEILKHQGFQTKVGEIVKGHCVNHEIDVIAEKDNKHFMVECKYHNANGTISNVKVPLYIQARFKDTEAQWLKLPGHETKFHQGWVVTNTKFSSDAIQYGNCAGLNLLGWDYPMKDGLKDLIDKLGLYPLTCLATLTKSEKQNLLGRKVVLCKEIRDNEQYLEQAGVNPSRIKGVLEKSRQLCKQLIHNGKQ